MKCILCYEDKSVSQFSDEHVFPEAIGGKLILHNLACKPCNEQHGHGIDSALINHPLIKLDRLAYKIKGKTGKVPNPFQNGHIVGKEGHKIQIKLTDSGNPESLYTVPKIEQQPNQNGLLISGHIDVKDAGGLEKMIKSICERQGMVISDEELEKIRNPEVIRSRPEIRIQTTYDLIKYQNGILKIAYELGCYWLGQEYLNDPIGNNIRQALRDQGDITQLGSVYGLRGTIGLKNILPEFSFWDHKPASHIAFLFRAQEMLSIYVRIFMTFEGIIEISKQAEKYQIQEGQFIEIDTQLDKMEESSFFQQMALIGQRSI